MRIDKSTFEFEWDKGNIGKNNNHRVKDQEAEEIFFDDSKALPDLTVGASALSVIRSAKPRTECPFENHSSLGLTPGAFWCWGKVILKDILHSKTEERFIILGKTKVDRVLYAVFTKRKNKIRIISARDLNKKEVQLYEQRS